MKTENPKESLIDKIRKLLRLADPDNGGTVPEMESALRKAQQLMTRHGIESMQLGEEKSASDIAKEEIATGRRKDAADRWIPQIIQRVFCVKVLWSRTYAPSIGKNGGWQHLYIFVGEPLDVELAKLTLIHIRASMMAGLDSFIATTGKPRNAHVKNSYFFGVASGFIRESVHAQHAEAKRHSAAEASRYALALVKKENRIEQFVKSEIKPKVQKSRSIARHDCEAYDSGYSAGAAIDFTTKIEGRAA
jgi:hypothetical protein